MADVVLEDLAIVFDTYLITLIQWAPGFLCAVGVVVPSQAQSFQSWELIQYLDKFHSNRFNPGSSIRGLKLYRPGTVGRKVTLNGLVGGCL